MFWRVDYPQNMTLVLAFKVPKLLQIWRGARSPCARSQSRAFVAAVARSPSAHNERGNPGKGEGEEGEGRTIPGNVEKGLNTTDRDGANSCHAMPATQRAELNIWEQNALLSNVPVTFEIIGSIQPTFLPSFKSIREQGESYPRTKPITDRL